MWVVSKDTRQCESASLSTVVKVNPAILHMTAIRANLTLIDSMVASLTSQHVLLWAANCFKDALTVWSCSCEEKNLWRLFPFGKGGGVPVPSPRRGLVSANFALHCFCLQLCITIAWLTRMIIDGIPFCGKRVAVLDETKWKTICFWLSKWVDSWNWNKNVLLSSTCREGW